MANPSNPLGAMVGLGGDYAITAGTTPTSGLIFSHIYITGDAVVSACNVGAISVSNGVASLPSSASVVTSRHYTGTLKAGYLICAGEGNGIKHDFKLTSGSAEGIIFKV